MIAAPSLVNAGQRGLEFRWGSSGECPVRAGAMGVLEYSSPDIKYNCFPMRTRSYSIVILMVVVSAQRGSKGVGQAIDPLYGTPRTVSA